MLRSGVWIVLIGLVMLSGADRVDAQTMYKPEAGGYRVEVIDETWRDDARAADPMKVDPGDGAKTAEEIRVSVAKSVRGRAVPVRVYVPMREKPADGKDAAGGKSGGSGSVSGSGEGKGDAGGSALLPVVVFSHGMGGSREGYEYIARHLATHGYLVVLPQHGGSDREAIVKAGKDKLLGRDDDKGDAKDDAKGDEKGGDKQGGRGERRASRGNRLMNGITEENTSDPANLENRPKDISFVLDQLTKHERFSKIADMKRVAVAGHSFGSYTTMAACGMRVDLPGREDVSFKDERVRCGIGMSPQGRGVMGVDTGAWDSIAVPMLIVTGTKDMGQGDRAASWRHEPYAALKSRDSYFLNITDATHMTFSGGSVRDRFGQTKEEHLVIVKQCCTAFLDAYLLENAEAKGWLVGKKIVEASGKGCELEGKGG